MRLKQLLLAGLLFPVCGHAQWLQNPFLHEIRFEEPHRHKVLAGYTYKLASTALTNRFFNDYLFTPFIEDEVKNTVLPKLKDGNYFGGYTERQVMYAWTPKEQPASRKSRHIYYLGAKSRAQRGSVFKPDVYRVLLYGNKNYAGKTAVGDGSAYREQAYQTLQGGIILQRYVPGWYDRRIVYGGGIGLVKGGRLFDIQAHQASLYTSPSGDSIFIRTRMESAYTDTDLPRSAFSGIGLSANFFIHFPVSEKSILAASVSDLGFISYFGATGIRFSSDESFSFTGYEVSDVNFENGLSGGTFILDSLEKRADSMKTRSGFSKTLPTQVQVCYRFMPSEKWDIKAGFEYVLSANSRLQLYGLSSYRFSENFNLSGGFQALGYSNFGVITALDVRLLKRIRVRLGTENLEGWFSPDKTTAQNAFGQVQVAF